MAVIFGIVSGCTRPCQCCSTGKGIFFMLLRSLVPESGRRISPCIQHHLPYFPRSALHQIAPCCRGSLHIRAVSSRSMCSSPRWFVLPLSPFQSAFRWFPRLLLRAMLCVGTPQMKSASCGSSSMPLAWSPWDCISCSCLLPLVFTRYRMHPAGSSSWLLHLVNDFAHRDMVSGFAAFRAVRLPYLYLDYIIIVMYITFNWHSAQSYVHIFVHYCYVHIIEIMVYLQCKVEKASLS